MSGRLDVQAASYAAPGRFARRADEPELVRRAVARAKEGDVSALHFLYVRFADDVCAYVRGIVRDPHEAEDVTQNVFAKLMTAIRRYEEREVPFAAWILTVSRNVALDHVRAPPADPGRGGAHERRGPRADGLRAPQCLREALAGLPEEQRQVLVLRHIAGLSPGEIAERLGKSEGSIHGLHHRGRGALQIALRELDAAPVTAGEVLARSSIGRAPQPG